MQGSEWGSGGSTMYIRSEKVEGNISCTTEVISPYDQQLVDIAVNMFLGRDPTKQPLVPLEKRSLESKDRDSVCKVK
jgi:hypothetical protein